MERQNPYGIFADKSVDNAFPALMRKTYLWMALGLVMTGLAAYYTAGNPDLMNLIYGNRVGIWVLIIAELAMVWTLSARIMRMSFLTAGILFAAYSVLNGATLASIFWVYDTTVIANTFFATAGTFGAMSLAGFFVKRDLGMVGRICFMALIGIIIATVINIFAQSEGLAYAISYIGVLIFVGLTAYDTQKIKLMLMQYGTEVSSDTMKLALLGSLTLYLDFVNLFLFLLRIFGGGSRD